MDVMRAHGPGMVSGPRSLDLPGTCGRSRARAAVVRRLHSGRRTTMTPASAAAERPEAPLFSDGLGDRIVAVDAATGDLLQILRVRPQLLAVPSFEFALRERAARLANFRHA